MASTRVSGATPATSKEMRKVMTTHGIQKMTNERTMSVARRVTRAWSVCRFVTPLAAPPAAGNESKTWRKRESEIILLWSKIQKSASVAKTTSFVLSVTSVGRSGRQKDTIQLSIFSHFDNFLSKFRCSQSCRARAYWGTEPQSY